VTIGVVARGYTGRAAVHSILHGSTQIMEYVVRSLVRSDRQKKEAAMVGLGTERGPLLMRCFASEWIGWVQAPEATQAISFKNYAFRILQIRYGLPEVSLGPVGGLWFSVIVRDRSLNTFDQVEGSCSLLESMSQGVNMLHRLGY
jgi:hypothetical protein